MARKVKLDILEQREQHEDRVDEQPEESGPLSPPAASDGQRPASVWMAKKWILAGVGALVLGIIAAGAVMFLTGAGKKTITSVPGGQSPAAMIPTVNRNLANFDNFVIDCRDAAGNVRIVTFAFAVELNKPAGREATGDEVELRGAIYRLSKKRSVASLLSPEDRKGWRKEIAAEVERRLGAGAVKAVYFTRFSVL